MPKKVNIHLSDSDVEAILAALQIIPYANYETSAAQMDINCFLAQTAAQKLISKNGNLTPNETRIVAASVIISRDYLSGMGDIDIPSTLKSDLQPYFFNYNRLAPLYDEVIRRIAPDLD